jgi:hypothetical protein
MEDAAKERDFERISVVFVRVIGVLHRPMDFWLEGVDFRFSLDIS